MISSPSALTAIEEKLHQVKAESSQDILNFPPQLDNQLLYLQDIVEKTQGSPHPSSREMFGEIKTELDGYVSEVDAVVADQLPELERLLKDSGVSYVMVAGDDKQ